MINLIIVSFVLTIILSKNYESEVIKWSAMIVFYAINISFTIYLFKIQFYEFFINIMLAKKTTSKFNANTQWKKLA